MADYIVERTDDGQADLHRGRRVEAVVIRKVRAGEAAGNNFDIVSAARTMTATRIAQSDGSRS